VLVKQDKIDAQSTVDGRLTFIEGQIKDTETSIDGIKEITEKKKMEVSSAKFSWLTLTLLDLSSTNSVTANRCWSFLTHQLIVTI
jgi:hypothetical protein